MAGVIRGSQRGRRNHNSNWVVVLLVVGGQRAFGLGVLHSAMARCGPLNLLCNIVRWATPLWSGGVALRNGSLRSSMRLSFQPPVWRLKRPLAELMPGKARLFPAAVLLRTTPPDQRYSNH